MWRAGKYSPCFDGWVSAFWNSNLLHNLVMKSLWLYPKKVNNSERKEMPPQPKLAEPSKPWTQSYASIPIREASWSVDRRCGWHNSPRPDIGNCQRAHWSCGWPDARDACKARPTIEAQGLASPHHHSPAWPHRPIKTRPSPLLFPPPLLCVSLISSPLFISHFFLLYSLSQSSQSKLTHSSFLILPL